MKTGLKQLIQRGGLALALTIVPISLAVLPILRGDAHETEIAGQIGATLHIEPNDRPRAGTESLVWFALNRRGGQQIPLSDCRCVLAVYAQPRRSGDTPIQQPALSATAAEGRQGLPSATVTFPRAGAYELVLKGNPVNAGAFDPFELRFSVTVAQ